MLHKYKGMTLEFTNYEYESNIVSLNGFKNYKKAKDCLKILGNNIKDSHLDFYSVCESLKRSIRDTRYINKNCGNIFQYTLSKEYKGLQFIQKINIDKEYFDSGNKYAILKSEIEQGFKHLCTKLAGTKHTKAIVSYRTMHDTVTGYYNNPYVNVRFNYLGSAEKGYVHAESGSILKIYQKNKFRRVFDNKKPLTSESHVGIEIEFYCQKSKDEIAMKLLPLVEYATLKDDGSISRPDSSYTTHELTLCIPESKKSQVLKQACDILKEIEAKVNKSCGLHVHLDMRQRNKELVYANLVTTQNLLYKINPASRSGNRYCKRTRQKVMHLALYRGDRYKGINAQAWRKFNTIEVRIHSGTVDYTKINNWCDILLSIVNETEYNKLVLTRAPSTIKSFVKTFKLPNHLTEYMVIRERQFKQDRELLEENVA